MTWLGRFIHGRDMRSPLRDGFLGIGGSAAKTDRSNQLQDTQNLYNVFSQGLGLSNQQNTTGQQQQQTGQQNLSGATGYWNNLLQAGRTQTAQNSAPAINATLAGSDAQRTQGAQFGSGRSGGTAAGNQAAATNTQSSIDDTINQNLVGGRNTAASGLAGAGATELSTGTASIGQALQGLGLSGSTGSNLLNNATNSYQFNEQQQAQQGAAAGQAAAQILLSFL
jgi:hypothetical protein